MAFNINFVEWTTPGSYTWDVPTGVNWVWVKAIAGGGAGGSSSKYFATDPGSGGGGAGEACENFQLAVTSGGTLNIVVGKGANHGTLSSRYYNVHAGPEDNYGGQTEGGVTAPGDGDTIVGPIRMKGAYSAPTPSAGHAGKGGGVKFGAQGERTAGAAAIGASGTSADATHWWPGASGGASSNNNSGIGTGGGTGPFSGGAEGSRTGGTGQAWGGGGGAASIFGPGGAGGAVDANAPTVTVPGAGGGGSGGNTVTYGGPSVDAEYGSVGGPGYVSLFYFTN